MIPRPCPRCHHQHKQPAAFQLRHVSQLPFLNFVAGTSARLTCLCTLQLGVPAPGPGPGHAPPLSVPANHSAVLAGLVLSQVCPHSEEVELHQTQNCPPRGPAGTAAQPQGARSGRGPGNGCPRWEPTVINLMQKRR